MTRTELKRQIKLIMESVLNSNTDDDKKDRAMICTLAILAQYYSDLAKLIKISDDYTACDANTLAYNSRLCDDNLVTKVSSLDKSIKLGNGTDGYHNIEYLNNGISGFMNKYVIHDKIDTLSQSYVKTLLGIVSKYPNLSRYDKMSDALDDFKTYSFSSYKEIMNINRNREPLTKRCYQLKSLCLLLMMVYADEVNSKYSGDDVWIKCHLGNEPDKNKDGIFYPFRVKYRIGGPRTMDINAEYHIDDKFSNEIRRYMIASDKARTVAEAAGLADPFINPPFSRSATNVASKNSIDGFMVMKRFIDQLKKLGYDCSPSDIMNDTNYVHCRRIMFDNIQLYTNNLKVVDKSNAAKSTSSSLAAQQAKQASADEQKEKIANRLDKYTKDYSGKYETFSDMIKDVYGPSFKSIGNMKLEDVSNALFIRDKFIVNFANDSVNASINLDYDEASRGGKKCDIEYLLKLIGSIISISHKNDGDSESIIKETWDKFCEDRNIGIEYDDKTNDCLAECAAMAGKINKKFAKYTVKFNQIKFL